MKHSRVLESSASKVQSVVQMPFVTRRELLNLCEIVDEENYVCVNF